jgi:hypothetical protein
MIRIAKRGEISRRDLQKPFGEFKTVNSLQEMINAKSLT